MQSVSPLQITKKMSSEVSPLQIFCVGDEAKVSADQEVKRPQTANKLTHHKSRHSIGKAVTTEDKNNC